MLRVLELEGAPAEIGRAFGESLRSEIAALYACRLDNAIIQAKRFGGRDVGESELLALARACLAPTRAFDPRGAAELHGIAEGAGLTPEQILAMNGLTDLRDALAWPGQPEAFGGCSACIVQADRSADGELMCGQTWDLSTDNMPFVIGLIRRPRGAPATWCVTTAGCLSLIGMNDRGLAVGTTNLRTRDARPGVPYLSLIHRALASDTLEEALEAIEGAQRAGGHYYTLADASGRAIALECTATRSARTEVTEGIYVHTNHCLHADCTALEADTPRGSSHARQKRLEELLAAAGARVDFAALERSFADRANGENAICRDDLAGISTNAVVAMAPARGEMRACQGLPDVANWITLREP